MSNSLVLQRKNASALSSPDKNLITKELVVFFHFKRRVLIARIVRQVITGVLVLGFFVFRSFFERSGREAVCETYFSHRAGPRIFGHKPSPGPLVA